jgi:hypothetical protein
VIGGFFGVNGKLRKYKKNSLVLLVLGTRRAYINGLFENIGTLAIDELALFQGERYTIVTNKRLKARKVP